MVWGIPITHEIIRAAITELYQLPSFNAIEALAFYKKYGVHFQTKAEIKTEALKMGYRFYEKIRYAKNRTQTYFEEQLKENLAIYDY